MKTTANDLLRQENVNLRKDYDQCCQLVADMHAAAMGQVQGPIRGVVEDIEDLRTSLLVSIADRLELGTRIKELLKNNK